MRPPEIAGDEGTPASLTKILFCRNPNIARPGGVELPAPGWILPYPTDVAMEVPDVIVDSAPWLLIKNAMEAPLPCCASIIPESFKVTRRAAHPAKTMRRSRPVRFHLLSVRRDSIPRW